MELNKDIFNIVDKNEFFTVSNYVKKFKENNPNCDVISLGIGDVSKPIINPCIEAMHEAVDELSTMEAFKGYGPSHGYEFLKKAILENEYKNMNFTTDEIYISNGTKTDTSSILELFDKNSKICVINPVYPIYRNGAMCLNRNVHFITAKEENNFVPEIPEEKYDIIYICSPNNPIGIVYSKEHLQKWVEYAKQNNAIILFDNAYYAFINTPETVKSIYEIKDADKVAIEFRSFSKALGFTGVRCSYYIIPNNIYPGINEIWKKRTINRFNGADYIAQKGAAASFTEESQKEIKANISDYLTNAKALKEAFENIGFTVFGGVDSPFLWVKIKENLNSWEIFKIYLETLNIVITPGRVFGPEGDRYFRVSGLASRENINMAIERLRDYYKAEGNIC